MSYYDVDAILAEEELVPISPLFDFDYLAHLDPDYNHTNNLSHDKSSSGATKNNRHVLAVGTRLKMPLWSIKKWAETGFVKMVLPRHFGKRMQERLRADAISVDLCKKSERYYMSGMFLIDLIHAAHKRLLASSNKSSGSPFSNLYQESKELKKTLVEIYLGSRFRKALDWTLSYHNSDISDSNGGGIDMEDAEFSNFTKILDVMEKCCLDKGYQGSRAYKIWKVHGNRRIMVSESALRGKVVGQRAMITDQNDSSEKKEVLDEGKRRSPDTVAAGGYKKMRSEY